MKRVASAVGEGSAVIADVHRYLAAYRTSTAAEGLPIGPAREMQDLAFAVR